MLSNNISDDFFFCLYSAMVGTDGVRQQSYISQFSTCIFQLMRYQREMQRNFACVLLGTHASYFILISPFNSLFGHYHHLVPFVLCGVHTFFGTLS